MRKNRIDKPVYSGGLWLLAPLCFLAFLIPRSEGNIVKRPRRISHALSFLPVSPSPVSRAGLTATPSPSPEGESLEAGPTPAVPTPPPGAATPSPLPTLSRPPSPSPAPSPQIPLRIRSARSIRYLEGGKLIRLEKDVCLHYENVSLKADKISVYIDRQEAYAEGNVEFRMEDSYIFTDKLRYDFLKDEGIMGLARGYVAPWYVQAEKVEVKRGKNQISCTRGYATTCDSETPHYRLQTSRFNIYPRDHIEAYHLLFYADGLPLMWMPYYRRSIKHDCRGFFFYPGYRDLWGFYFLSGYHWCAPSLYTTLHLDYRYRRDWATGLDGSFYFGDLGRGNWQTYYLKDKGYKEDGESKREERYLAQLWYRHYFPLGIRGDIAAHYLSDPTIRSDFFRSEYDADSQPKSHIYLYKNLRNMGVSLEATKRLNKFYKVTEKLPEAVVQVKEIPLWETNFYYQGSNTYTNFYRRYANESRARYEAQRFDTFHQLSYSDKYFGWLNLLPRASLRETFYSDGPAKSTGEKEQKDFWRRVFSCGAEISTDIYGIFPAQSRPLRLNKIRHVITPSAGYYFTDNPTVSRKYIYQFDSVDKIERANYTKLSLRNQLQTKRLIRGYKRSWTLLDLRLYTYMATRPDRDNQGNLFTDLVGNLELTPFEWIGLDMDFTYDPYQEVLEKSSLTAWAGKENIWRTELYYQYRRDKERQRISSRVYWRLNPKWACEVYGRYDLTEEMFDEESITLHRDLHCWEARLTYRHRESIEDNEIFLALWIKAFPRSPLNLSN